MFKKLKNKQLISQRVVNILLPILVVSVAFVIILSRYKLAIDMPNFYAEDGKVYLNNLITKNPVDAMLTGFNGYLVVGQYLLLYASMIINNIFGSGLASLATAAALVSYGFLAVTMSLPYLMFRRQLGNLVSLMVVALGVFVPLAGWDYAIIGTIGNLKFAFLYIAFLVILYRNINFDNRIKTVLCDLVLLLCLLTNVAVFFIMPFILWPYRSRIKEVITSRKILNKRYTALLSTLLLLALSASYIVVAYLKGIPQIEGYLDTPYNQDATIVILDRIATYGLLHPVTPYFNYIASLGVIGLLLFLGIKNPKTRFVTIFGFWSLNVGAWLFVLNRPGIGDYFLTYDHKGGPAQFFYASNLIFYFVVGWLIKDRVRKARITTKLVASVVFLIYLSVTVPQSGSWNKTPIGYDTIGTATQSINLACSKPGDTVTLQIYPTNEWTWTLDRYKACPPSAEQN